MRILYLCEYATLNGGENSLLAVLGSMPSEDQAVVACPAGPLFELLGRRGVETVQLGLHDDNSVRFPAEEIDRRIVQRIEEIGPAIVHANSLAMARILGRLADRITVPRVGHLRDIVNLSRSAIRHLGGNDRLLAVSEATRRHHVQRGLDDAKAFVLHNGIDSQPFQMAASGKLRREFGLSDKDIIALTVGQLGIRKGLDTVVDAARELMHRDARLHWFIVGERHSQKDESVAYHEGLVAAGLQAPLRGRLHFTGRRDDVPELLADADILVHAARQEPLGRVLLEAGASGTAIVATDVGGTKEIYPHGEALLVPADDAPAMVKAIHRLIDSPVLRKQMGRQALDRITTSFTVTASASRLWRHYHELLGRT